MRYLTVHRRAEPRQSGPRPAEQTSPAVHAQRALDQWWVTLSANERKALEGPERRTRWRRGTEAP
jgi:hypothetical protein